MSLGITPRPRREASALAWELVLGDSKEVLAQLEPGSLDSGVMDPPYELGFMGKGWDRSGIAYDVDLWRLVLRALKPGSHLAAFGGTRTYHRMACAIEDAGFEVRDQLAFLHGQGFPKSVNVSIAMDKAAGVQHVSEGPPTLGMARDPQWNALHRRLVMPPPTTDLAKQWEGWHTALKPALEPICLARVPLVGTVANTVATYGVGAIDVERCRVGRVGGSKDNNPNIRGGNYGSQAAGLACAPVERLNKGRYPSNLVLAHDARCGGRCHAECPCAMLDRQSGLGQSGVAGRRSDGVGLFGLSGAKAWGGYGDAGGASRFYYTAKPTKREKNLGLHGMEVKTPEEMTGRKVGAKGLRMPNGDGTTRANPRAGTSGRARANSHPTVKSLQLMRWLVRLVTPPGGIVLDAFAGSGTTGVAAVGQGFGFLGIDRDPNYAGIARARIGNADHRQGGSA